MTVILLMRQPLRLPQALTYLERLPDDTKPILLTAAPSSALPGVAEYVDVRNPSPQHRSRPSTVSHSLRARAGSWTKSGSGLGMRVAKWVRSAEWKMRYVDRLFAILESGGERQDNALSQRLVEELDLISAATPVDEVAVFDLFDLPAALKASDKLGCPIVVR